MVIPSYNDIKLGAIVLVEFKVGMTIDKKAGIYIGNLQCLWLSKFKLY